MLEPSFLSWNKAPFLYQTTVGGGYPSAEQSSFTESPTTTAIRLRILLTNDTVNFGAAKRNGIQLMSTMNLTGFHAVCRALFWDCPALSCSVYYLENCKLTWRWISVGIPRRTLKHEPKGIINPHEIQLLSPLKKLPRKRRLFTCHSWFYIFPFFQDVKSSANRINIILIALRHKLVTYFQQKAAHHEYSFHRKSFQQYTCSGLRLPFGSFLFSSIY